MVQLDKSGSYSYGGGAEGNDAEACDDPWVFVDIALVTDSSPEDTAVPILFVICS